MKSTFFKDILAKNIFSIALIFACAQCHAMDPSMIREGTFYASSGGASCLNNHSTRENIQMAEGTQSIIEEHSFRHWWVPFIAWLPIVKHAREMNRRD